MPLLKVFLSQVVGFLIYNLTIESVIKADILPETETKIVLAIVLSIFCLAVQIYTDRKDEDEKVEASTEGKNIKKSTSEDVDIAKEMNKTSHVNATTEVKESTSKTDPDLPKQAAKTIEKNEAVLSDVSEVNKVTSAVEAKVLEGEITLTNSITTKIAEEFTEEIVTSTDVDCPETLLDATPSVIETTASDTEDVMATDVITGIQEYTTESDMSELTDAMTSTMPSTKAEIKENNLEAAIFPDMNPVESPEIEDRITHSETSEEDYAYKINNSSAKIKEMDAITTPEVEMPSQKDEKIAASLETKVTSDEMDQAAFKKPNTEFENTFAGQETLDLAVEISPFVADSPPIDKNIDEALNISFSKTDITSAVHEKVTEEKSDEINAIIGTKQSRTKELDTGFVIPQPKIDVIFLYSCLPRT